MAHFAQMPILVDVLLQVFRHPLHQTGDPIKKSVAEIPLSDDDNVRIEHRFTGADANPYLVVASFWPVCITD